MDRSRAGQTLLTMDAAGVPCHRYRFHAMASMHEIQLSTPDRALADRAAAAAIADVRRIEAKYSRFRDDSVTSAINRAAGAAGVAIDAETAALLRYADRCHAASGGRFDITSGVLRRAWDFRRDPPRVPSSDEIDALRPLIGWRRVEWSDDEVRLPYAGMELDFGGIGKEYACDRAVAICRDRGVRHALVNLGGDVRAIGGRADGSPWRIGIRHPMSVAGSPESANCARTGGREAWGDHHPGANEPIATVALRDGALATSGDYERFFELDGQRYCHLLDPRSGMPVSCWRSASVIAPIATLAGSYATIAMLLEREAAPFLASMGVAFLLVARDMTLSTGGTGGSEASFAVSAATS